MHELLLDCEDASRRKEVVEHLNSNPDEFEQLIDTIFTQSGKDYSDEKKIVLNLVDFLVPRLGISIIERAIQDPVSKIRLRGLQAMYRGSFDSFNPQVLQMLEDTSESFEVRKWAIHILGRTDPRGYARVLRGIIKDATIDIGLRKESIFALTNEPSDTTIGALCMLLGDSNVEIRQSGAWALGRIGGDDAINCLLASLEDEDEVVRDWAIRGLRDSDNTRALQGLADAMASVDSEYQEQFIRLVVEKRSEIILRAIAELLESQNAGVRRTAAWAMGVTPYPPAAGTLEKLLADEDEQVQQYAKRALERMGRLGLSDFGLML
jgi:hypothetical protein